MFRMLKPLVVLVLPICPPASSNHLLIQFVADVAAGVEEAAPAYAAQSPAEEGSYSWLST